MRNMTPKEAAIMRDAILTAETGEEPAPWPGCLDCGLTPELVRFWSEDTSTFSYKEWTVLVGFEPCRHSFCTTMTPLGQENW